MSPAKKSSWKLTTSLVGLSAGLKVSETVPVLGWKKHEPLTFTVMLKLIKLFSGIVNVHGGLSVKQLVAKVAVMGYPPGVLSCESLMIVMVADELMVPTKCAGVGVGTAGPVLPEPRHASKMRLATAAATIDLRVRGCDDMGCIPKPPSLGSYDLCLFVSLRVTTLVDGKIRSVTVPQAASERPRKPLPLLI